jgi:hypothetical protein
MQTAIQLDPTAIEIGKVLKNARLDSNNTSRRQFVQKKELKGKITSEGVRKIEEGERVPKLENIRLLAGALNLPKKQVKRLEDMALKKTVERATRKAGNISVTFKIAGEPMLIQRLPPKRKAEMFARDVVQDLIPVLGKLGVEIPEDIDLFRRTARSMVLKRLET